MEKYEIDDYCDEEYTEQGVLLNRVFSFYPNGDGPSEPVIIIGQWIWDKRAWRINRCQKDLAICRVKKLVDE